MEASNLADVCPLPLRRLAPAGVTPADLEERLALAEEMRLPLRPFLFQGGLPERLLPTARLLCATAEADVRAARRAVDPSEAAAEEAAAAAGASAPEEEPAAFDWSKVDWSLDDPFAACAAAAGAADHGPVSTAAERGTLEALIALTSELLGAVPGGSTAAAAEEARSEVSRRYGEDAGGFASSPGGGAELAALVYRCSQSGLLREARQGFRSRLARLADATGAGPKRRKEEQDSGGIQRGATHGDHVVADAKRPRQPPTS